MNNLEKLALEKLDHIINQANIDAQDEFHSNNGQYSANKKIMNIKFNINEAKKIVEALKENNK